METGNRTSENGEGKKENGKNIEYRKYGKTCYCLNHTEKKILVVNPEKFLSDEVPYNTANMEAIRKYERGNGFHFLEALEELNTQISYYCR